MKEFNVTDLRLGDRCRMVTSGEGFAYSTFTVERISETEVECIRPYIHTSYCIYGRAPNSGKILTYFGWEKMVFRMDTDIKFWIIERDSTLS